MLTHAGVDSEDALKGTAFDVVDNLVLKLNKISSKQCQELKDITYLALKQSESALMKLLSTLFKPADLDW